MASAALEGLLIGIEEVRDLQRANPAPAGGISARPRVTRAINRASVVMLSSHLEKYLRAVSEEAVGIVNTHGVAAAVLPEIMRLQHSSGSVDDLARTQWNNRAQKLGEFAQNEGWLWGTGTTGTLDHERLLTWMKTPKSEMVRRLYRLWGIEDIFREITRTPATRVRLTLKLDELVTKRNNIAHGDWHADATPRDITEYRQRVQEFCSRADRRLARQLSKSLAVTCPWY